MKHKTLPTLFVVMALLLSSCSMHLGLSKFLGTGNSSGKTSKHVKVTDTPPSLSNSTAPGTTAVQTSALSVAHGTTVAITSTSFQPNVLKVKLSKTVTWTNNDTVQESVTSDTAGLFDSGPLNPGAKYTFTFTQAGTFKYHSTTNSSLTGAIVVLP